MSLELVSIISNSRFSIAHHYYTIFSLFNNAIQPLSTKEIWERITSIADYTDDIVKDKFAKSSIVVLEISSRIYQDWSNEKNESMHTRVTLLSDEEIENNMIELRKAIYPKKMIILPNFFMEDESEKKYMITLLHNITKKLNIPFVNDDPRHSFSKATALQRWIHKRAIMMHLYQKIDEIEKARKNPCVFQTYYIQSNSTTGIQGFGDFIRGCIYLYKLFEKSDITLKINFSNTFLNDIFYCKNHLSVEECETIRSFLHPNEINIDTQIQNQFIFTNKYEDDYFNEKINYVDNKCRNFIVQNCFLLRNQFKKTYIKVKKRLKLEKYVVIHIRTKDWEMCDINKHLWLIHNISQKYIDTNKLNTPTKKQILLISNNSELIKQINLPYIVKTGLDIGHTGLHLTTKDQNTNTIIELMLMIECEKIYQLSHYSWGSGFSDMVNKLFKVPIERYQMEENYNKLFNPSIN